MKILMVSAPYKPTPPSGYAGIERVVYWYVRELLKRGHEVTTVCVPGSTVPGERIVWDPEDLPEAAHVREWVFGDWFLSRGPVWGFFDIVHDHTHLKYPSMACESWGMSFLNTCHLPDPPFTKNAVALSEAHKKEVSPTAEIIHLGVPAEDYRFCDKKNDYGLYLGYIAPHKGVHLALRAAKELGVRLVLAGPIDQFPAYFEEEIDPLLDAKRHWWGEVEGHLKLNLLMFAKFIVLPIQWEEPGSTVAFEALACGTPVIGFRRGALKDIITKPSIGTLADNYRGLKEAMKYPPTDYAACRAHVVENFDIPSRIDAYERLYEGVLGGETW